MNDIEDRFEAAARALDRKFPDSSVPPLRLPAHPHGSSTTGRRLARGWLIPLAAAAAVVAVIAGSLALAGGPGQTAPSAAASGPEGTPPYYVFLTQSFHAEARISSTATGRALVTVKAPRPYNNFVLVSGAADDRTFVLAADTFIDRPPYAYMPLQFFLLRFDPRGRTVRLTKVPVHLSVKQVPLAIALSPDGSRLAVGLPQYNRPKTGQPRQVGQQITIFSLATGASRTWTGEHRHVGIYQGGIHAFSWSADGRTLEYPWDDDRPVTTLWYASLLDTDAPGKQLPPGVRFNPPDAAFALVMTPDKTLALTGEPKNSTWGVSEFAGPRFRPVNHLGTITPPGTTTDILWTNSSGSLMIIRPGVSIRTPQIGILGHGRYLRLPVSLDVDGIAW